MFPKKSGVSLSMKTNIDWSKVLHVISKPTAKERERDRLRSGEKVQESVVGSGIRNVGVTNIYYALQHAACALVTGSHWRGCILRTVTNLWTFRGDRKGHDGSHPILEGLMWNRNWISLVEVQKARRGPQPSRVIKANICWESAKWPDPMLAIYISSHQNVPQTDRVFFIITPILQMRKMKTGKIR